MTDPHDDGPVCDFCKLAVEPDETLTPMFIGEPNQPKPHRLTATRDKTANGYRSDLRVMGKPASVYVALREALDDCPDIDLKLAETVQVVEPMRGNVDRVKSTSFESTVNRDKVGVEVKIRPKDTQQLPDAELCDTCVKMFRDL